jgi:hypothetical protein
MKRGIAICSLLIFMALTSNSQKLWEKVYAQKDNNISSMTGSTLVNDSMVVISGFRNTLTCTNLKLGSVNSKGKEIWTIKDTFPDNSCGYYNCYGSFRYLSATPDFIYACGEAVIGDIIGGDEPVFLRKFDFNGDLIYSVAYNNAEKLESGIHRTNAMVSSDEWGVIIAFESTVNGIIKFDPQGNVVWEKYLNLLVQDIVFTEQGKFAILANDSIFHMSVAGEIQQSFAIEPSVHMVYLDQKLYFAGLSNVFYLNLESGQMEVVLSSLPDAPFKRLSLVNDSIWALSQDVEKAYIYHISAAGNKLYNLPIPAIDILNFFVTKEQIIITGTSKQGQMSLIAYGLAETNPDVSFHDIELVDFEISNMQSHYMEWGDFVVPLKVTFDTQLTIRNNGNETIELLGIHSDREGGYTCGRHYYYKWMESLSIEPLKEISINLGSSVDYQSKWSDISVCYTLMAPNSELEKNIANNNLCKTFDLTSVQELPLQDTWKVYPNPLQDRLTIEAPGYGIFDFRIFSTDGKVVFSGHSSEKIQQFDTSKLPSGIYLLYLQQENNLFTKKIVKR